MDQQQMDTTPGTLTEVEMGTRFNFGDNWSKFLKLLDDSRIEQAEKSLKDMLQLESLEGRRFIDIGSGSGLFSLAARRLGAEVVSFDYDPQCVGCASELRRRYFPEDPNWEIKRGSVLDPDFLSLLGKFDIVYSWGVLHHTGAMWEALDNVSPLVADGGLLYIAIYNDQGRATRLWTSVKRLYLRAPGPLKWVVLGGAAVRLWGPSMVRDLLQGQPFRTWKTYSRSSARGMDPWRDVVDWTGGYPFEVAKPEEILDFYRARGFELLRMVTCGGGQGCNEFVFAR